MVTLSFARENADLRPTGEWSAKYRNDTVADE